jgi:hypothetical protein
MPEVFELLIEPASTRGRCQLTVAMGRAADEPELILEPFQVLEVMAAHRALKRKAGTTPACASGPATTSATSAPTRPAARHDAARAHVLLRRRALTLGIEADGSHQGLPLAPDEDYVGRQHPRQLAARHLGARRAPALHPRPHRRRPLGLLPRLLLRDECRAGCSWTARHFGRIGNNPYCHHRALELLREGKRERRSTAALPTQA